MLIVAVIVTVVIAAAIFSYISSSNQGNAGATSSNLEHVASAGIDYAEDVGTREKLTGKEKNELAAKFVLNNTPQKRLTKDQAQMAVSIAWRHRISNNVTSILSATAEKRKDALAYLLKADLMSKLGSFELNSEISKNKKSINFLFKKRW